MANVSIRNVFTQEILYFDNDAGYPYTHDGIEGFLVVKNFGGSDIVILQLDDAVDQINDIRKVMPPLDMSHMFSTSLTEEDTEEYFDDQDVIVPPPVNFRVYYADWINPDNQSNILKVALYLINNAYHVMREYYVNNVAVEIVASGYNFLTANGITNIQVNPNDYNIVSPVTDIGGLMQPANFPVSDFLALMPGYTYQSGIFYYNQAPPQPTTDMPVGAIRWDAWYPRYYDGDASQEKNVQLPWLPSYINNGNFPWGPGQGGISTFRDVAWTVSGGMTMVNPEYYQYRPFHTATATPQTFGFPYYDSVNNSFITTGNIRTSSLRYRGTDQWAMDAELQYAQDIGLNYWMFLFYPDDSPLCYGRRLYRNTLNKRGIKMAYATHQMGGNPLEAVGTYWRGVYDNSVDEIADAMTQSYYQTTTDGRPIVFLDFLGDDRISQMQAIKNDITAKYQQKGGTQQIYWVLLVISIAEPYHYQYVHTLGLDSITWYSQYGDNQDYAYMTSIHARTMNRINDLFNNGSRAGKDLTPCFTASFFNKPMWTHSPSGKIELGNGHIYTNVATPSELTQGLQQVYNWANQNNCKTMIIYSWNEHYEAGICLCPRQLPNGDPDLSYVNAAAAVLNP